MKSYDVVWCPGPPFLLRLRTQQLQEEIGFLRENSKRSEVRGGVHPVLHDNPAPKELSSKVQEVWFGVLSKHEKNGSYFLNATLTHNCQCVHSEYFPWVWQILCKSLNHYIGFRPRKR